MCHAYRAHLFGRQTAPIHRPDWQIARFLSLLFFYDAILSSKRTKSTAVIVSCPSLSVQREVSLWITIGNSSHLTSSQLFGDFKINCMRFILVFVSSFQTTSLPTNKQKHKPFTTVKPPFAKPKKPSFLAHCFRSHNRIFVFKNHRINYRHFSYTDYVNDLLDHLG